MNGDPSFRQSNVTYSEYLTIKLTGRNRLAIVGGTDDDLDVIRNCLQSRWPYPLSRDYKVNIKIEINPNSLQYFVIKDL